MPDLTPGSTSNILNVIQQRLSNISDSHLQSKVLLEYSELSLSPAVPTSQVIDFLFSFLEQHNQKALVPASHVELDSIPKKALAVCYKMVGKKGNQAEVVIVYSILKGLYSILQVKPVIVKPMIQVEGMKTQLTRCFSTSEDFKLRCETLRIVLDCMMISKREEEALDLALQCMKDSSYHLHEIALRGLLRLLDVGYHFSAKKEETLKTVATLLHYGESASLQNIAAQILIAIADQNPNLDVTLGFLDLHKPLSVADAVFLLFGQGLITMSSTCRAYVANAIATIADLISTSAIEDSLQRSQVDERVQDNATDTLLLTTTGSMLMLLEDPSTCVAVQASYAVGRLLTNSMCSTRIIDRSIKALFEVFARVASDSSDHISIGIVLKTLNEVLAYRNRRTTPAYLLSINQMTCILASLPVPNVQVLELLQSTIQLCDVTKGDDLDRMISTRVETQRSWLVCNLDQELFSGLGNEEQVSLKQNVHAWHREFVERICQAPDDVAKLGMFIWQSDEVSGSHLPLPQLSILIEKLLDALSIRLSEPKNDMWPCIPFQWIDWIRAVKKDVPELTIICMNQLFRQCQSLVEACKYLFVKGALDNLKTQITLQKIYGHCMILDELSKFNGVTSSAHLICGINKARTIQLWQKTLVDDVSNSEDARSAVRSLIKLVPILSSSSPNAKIFWPLENQQESFHTLAPYLQQLEISFALKYVQYTARVYIKAQLWDGSTHYHKVPRSAFHWYTLDSCKAQYSISFPVSQSLDPVCVKLSICIHHSFGFTSLNEEKNQINDTDFVPLSREVRCFLNRSKK
uniref:Uncharacterized protein AlNc14C14G1617 n=1 Tax=Albugo laibachii Nc14 TaxID=890382 RepID=F0W3V1_9STRA|nr:conserved hypothetical protein [Albugo laibachii Nc14]|eukprot:CCA15700.1 conserved hypothetical protein [Albugo laibachii Nc14]